MQRQPPKKPTIEYVELEKRNRELQTKYNTLKKEHAKVVNAVNVLLNLGCNPSRLGWTINIDTKKNDLNE